MSGFTRVDNNILEEVSRRKFNATQLSIIMIVWRMTTGYNREDHELAVNYFVKATGFSKRNIQETINNLIESKVLIETQAASFNQTRKIAFNKNTDEWLVPSRTKSKQVKKSSPHEKKFTSSGDQLFTSSGDQLFTQEIKEIKEIKIDDDAEQLVQHDEQQDLPPVAKDDFIPKPPSAENKMTLEEKQYREKLLENEFIKLRGTGFFVSAADLQSIERVAALPIEIEKIIKWMQECFEQYTKANPRDRIQSFKYYEKVINSKLSNENSNSQTNKRPRNALEFLEEYKKRKGIS